MNWLQGLRLKVRFNEPLKEHTSLKIGGRIEYFIEPADSQVLKELLLRLKIAGLEVRVLGAGSNILAGDGLLKAAAIRLSSPAFKGIMRDGSVLYAGSGLPLSQMLSFSVKQGLSGLEFLSGIPGTLGGALVMNAGIPGREIGDLVENIAAMDYNGRIKILSGRQIKFAYRSSNLSRQIVLGAAFRLQPGNRRQIEAQVKRYFRRRRLSQDYRRPSAGCIFRNPPGFSAGKLIELCGLKGKTIGAAGVSWRHANFILNLGGARAAEVMELMRLIKQEVRRRFGINLQLEVKIWK
jgi:UDP-N-acetylmuramate dehydrogenase